MTCQTLTIRFCVFALCAISSATVFGQLVPGTGTRIDYLGDDFENPNWGFVHRFPKSSREQNEQANYPMGYSTNGVWIEGPERGQPDHMKVVPTPPGGLPGSQYALLVRTLNSGVPGTRSYDVQQDDLVMNYSRRLGTNISPSEQMSVVVRVYLPPFDQWENRTGPQFGFRLGCGTTVVEQKKGFFGGKEKKDEPYWPGIWVNFRSETDKRFDEDSVYLTVRGNNRGHDFKVKDLQEAGWLTLGMSMTGDGRIHYYASEGVDALAQADHLTSQFPYSFRSEYSNAYFFNYCNRNDGRTWSTPFVIDDTQVYLVNASRVKGMADRRVAAQRRRQEMAQRNAAATQQQRQRQTSQRTNVPQQQPAPVLTRKQGPGDIR